MRGNQGFPAPDPINTGSIPAHAGEPCRRSSRHGLIRVYPRACGGTVRFAITVGSAVGLSPRMRGNRRGRVHHVGHPGSIPAHAGEPAASFRLSRSTGVYPRACGGTRHAPEPRDNRAGLSPRMRGNHARPGRASHLQRSIPAHAGEPPHSVTSRMGSRVYPRACGGTQLAHERRHAHRGLSPRMRGNRSAHCRWAPVPGSIPAHAGEPRAWAEDSTVCRVYPRACGGTFQERMQTGSQEGLSPRMRGNRRARLARPPTRVYPRACGGTPIG